MKKILVLMFVVLMFISLTGCMSSVGHEDMLDEIESAEEVGEFEGWTMETVGFINADKSIQNLLKKVEIDGEPQMYFGYQITLEGINYAFTVKDSENVDHLYILRQTSNKEVTIVSETTEFSFLDFFEE